MRTLFVMFLLGHAAVHGVMWTLPFTPAASDMPFNPAHSWVWGESRAVAVVLAGLATVAFGAAAFGFAIEAGWWPPVMVAAAVVSLALMLVYFSPYWLVGIVLSAVLAVYALQASPVT